MFATFTKFNYMKRKCFTRFVPVNLKKAFEAVKTITSEER